MGIDGSQYMLTCLNLPSVVIGVGPRPRGQIPRMTTVGYWVGDFLILELNDMKLGGADYHCFRKIQKIFQIIVFIGYIITEVAQ